MNENQGLQKQAPTLEKQVALLSSQTSQWITSMLADPKMGVTVPKGYNVGNEVSSALYAISRVKDKNGQSVLESCDSSQIMNEVRDMVMQGLSVSKKHVYPIIYNGELSLQRSYFGTRAALGYMRPDLEIGVNVLYEGDTYDYCTDEIGGYNYITNVHSSLENRDKEIIGAYGVIYEKETGKRVYGCVMTMKEIRANWAKSKSRDSSTQKEFPQEMAKRTLINRMCKMFVNGAANTNTEVVGAFNRMTEAEFIDVTPVESPKTDAEKQKMLHERSKGSEGLEALLKTEEKKAEEPTPEEAPSESSPEPVAHAEPSASTATPSGPFKVPERYRKAASAHVSDGLDDDEENTGDVAPDEYGELPF